MPLAGMVSAGVVLAAAAATAEAVGITCVKVIVSQAIEGKTLAACDVVEKKAYYSVGYYTWDKPD